MIALDQTRQILEEKDMDSYDDILFISKSIGTTVAKDLFSWVKKSEGKVHPLIIAAVFHYEFVFIHPFADGNGRMARLWHTVILCKWRSIFGYIPLESQSEFIHSFEKSHPNITLSFRAMSFVEMNAGLEEGTVDALLTLENSAPSKSLFSLTPLCPLENCILYSRKHPVCQNHADPTLDDFAGSTLYYLPSTDVTDMDGILRKILAPYHLDLALKMERSWQTCIANVLLGRGIVLTDEWAFEKTQSQFLSAVLPEAQALVLVTAKNNPYVEDLRKHLLLAIRGVE